MTQHHKAIMSNLASSSCDACRKGAPVITPAEIEELMPQLDPAWKIVVVGGVPRLVRKIALKNFLQAMELAERIGELAEAAGHHPALLIEWGQLTVSWWTHAILNLHRSDFVMAARTDRALQHFSQAASGDSEPENTVNDH